MELTQFCILAGFFGLRIARTNSENLPQPQLTLEPPGVIKSGQSADLLCTAPSNYKGAIFYLYLHRNREHLQTLQATEDTHNVTFTLREVTASDSKGYVCLYQIILLDAIQASELSNVLYLTIIDENYNTTSPIEPEEFPNAPSWIIPLVAGIIGGAVLVLSIILASCMVIRFQQKKRQEQRDRESVWVPQNMSPDWSITNNMAYSVDQNEHSGDGLPSPFMGNSEISEDIVEKPFSTFQT
ncbi:protein HIDE1 isoform X5 [Bombina bombina]|uniref:protein HIDE1 isoform X5 n=1 Tax=Bombina bombina TaxID=8345 RepID=UPI00235AC277|nr:protein HIDE1 isoform X5 [Bombina bombina]